MSKAAEKKSYKFFVTNEPPLPSECIACKKSFDGKSPFYDFGISLDYYGAVLFCSPCSYELARVVGFIPDHEEKEAVAEVERLKEKLKEANVRIRSLHDALSSFGLSESSSDGVLTATVS